MNNKPSTGVCDFQKIVLATDFSDAGRAAFDAAMKLCSRFKASLKILHVFEYASLIPVESGGQMLELDSFHQDAELHMDRLIYEARNQGVDCEGSVLCGVVPDAILEAVEKERVDLIVLGTRAIHGFERLVFGSTAEAVLRKATCPVYTVGPQAALQDGQAAPSSGPIVFATDFDLKTTQAMREAGLFSRLLEMPLHCLHVLPRMAEDGEHKGVIPNIITEGLQHLADTLDHNAVAPICAVTYGSEISNAIVEYARDNEARLIVLGVRRASLTASHVPAHIAYHIIAEAPCPVLTMAFPREPGDARRALNTGVGTRNFPGACLESSNNNLVI